MLKNFENETLFGRTKWLYFCFVFVYFYQFLSGFIKEKDFFEASFVHFYQPKKLQATDQTLRAVYRQQHSDSLRTACTDEHFSRQKADIFLPAPAAVKHLAPQFIFSYRANLSLPAFSNIHFYKSSTLKPLSCSPATSHKKTEPSAQFFPLYISSIFPGLYNPQFSSCSTKPKCLRMPAKSGSLLLSSVITGLSFFSHSRLNSISLLPRPL